MHSPVSNCSDERSLQTSAFASIFVDEERESDDAFAMTCRRMIGIQIVAPALPMSESQLFTIDADGVIAQMFGRTLIKAICASH